MKSSSLNQRQRFPVTVPNRDKRLNQNLTFKEAPQGKHLQPSEE